MKKRIEIDECFHCCPFFGTSMDGMECNHPYWEDKGAYENMIIRQDNIGYNNGYGKIPEKCPLRNDELTITYRLC